MQNYRRFENSGMRALKGMTAKQLWHFLVEHHGSAFEDKQMCFDDLLKLYELNFEKMLKVNKRILIEDNKREQ